MSSAYEQDFFSWTLEQAAAVREGNLGRMDREHLAGEIEERGRSEQRALAERMAVIVAHLLTGFSASLVDSRRTNRPYPAHRGNRMASR